MVKTDRQRFDEFVSEQYSIVGIGAGIEFKKERDELPMRLMFPRNY